MPHAVRLKHSTGEVRGHASLMQPTKPRPGVPFVDLPLCGGPKETHRTQRLSCEGGVIQPPSALAIVVASSDAAQWSSYDDVLSRRIVTR
jgi:hypothetical protein